MATNELFVGSEDILKLSVSSENKEPLMWLGLAMCIDTSRPAHQTDETQCIDPVDRQFADANASRNLHLREEMER